MIDDEDQDRSEPVADPLDNEDAGRQVAHLTGMSAEAAKTFAAFHSGRITRRPALDDAA